MGGTFDDEGFCVSVWVSTPSDRLESLGGCVGVSQVHTVGF